MRHEQNKEFNAENGAPPDWSGSVSSSASVVFEASSSPKEDAGVDRREA